MTAPFTVAGTQNCASPDMAANITEADAQVRRARDAGADLICTPEYFGHLDMVGNLLLSKSFPEDDHPILRHFTAVAKELECWLLIGSVAVDSGGDKCRNRSYLVGPDGRSVSRYDKIHLFDVDLPGGESYRESAFVEPGGEARLAETPWGLLGHSICYDLRFPQLYHALAQAGAHFLAVPAAFTRTTGQAHWHVLLRARAIETGSFVFAPCQHGAHGAGPASYGHSLIIDPWGEVLADGGEDAGFVTARIDPAKVEETRWRIAALRHARALEAPAVMTTAGVADAAE